MEGAGGAARHLGPLGVADPPAFNVGGHFVFLTQAPPVLVSFVQHPDNLLAAGAFDDRFALGVAA